MNLAYLVNRPKINIKKTSYAAGTVTADHEPINVEGFNSLSLTLTGSGLRTFNLFLEGRVSAVGNWIQLPVHNSNFVFQPYICIVDTYPTAEGDLHNTYTANINGFSEVRTRIEYFAGSGLTIGMVISEAEFNALEPIRVRRITGTSTILTRDAEFIGRKYKAADTSSDPLSIRPIWFGDTTYREVIFKNNINKVLILKTLRLFTGINSNVPAFVYDIDREVNLGGELVITSTDYPQLLSYGGVVAEIWQIGRTIEPVSAGSYDFTVNVRR